jgi:hypothetical protein
MLWAWPIEVATPADASPCGELLNDFDDRLVTLGHLTILFWLPEAGSLFTPPMSARPVAPGLAVQLLTRSSRPWIEQVQQDDRVAVLAPDLEDPLHRVAAKRNLPELPY